MSRLLVTNKSFGIVLSRMRGNSRTVLRGKSSRKGADLPDIDSISTRRTRSVFNPSGPISTCMAWAGATQELRISAMMWAASSSLMGYACICTVDAATLFWAGMLATGADFPEESTHVHRARGLLPSREETNYKSLVQLSPFKGLP